MPLPQSPDDIPIPSMAELQVAKALSKLAPDEQKFAVKAGELLLQMSYKEIAQMAGLPDDVIARASRIASKVSFQEYLEAIGVTREFMASALMADIMSKPGNRVSELTLLAKVLKMLEPAKIEINQNFGEQKMELIQNFLDGGEASLANEASVADDPIDVSVLNEDDDD